MQTQATPGPGRRTADLAYACYGAIALLFLSLWILDTVLGEPQSSEEFASRQGWGMLLLLPLSLAAIAAAIVGARSSFRLWRWWLREWGLVVLPLLLIALLVVFFLAEEKQVSRSWLVFANWVYVLAALVFAARWFGSARKAEQSP